MVDKSALFTENVNMPKGDPKQRFGERLRRARLLRGLSLRGLSDALEGSVSHAALQKYEKGVMGPDSKVLNAICATLELRPDFFFQRRDVELAGIEFRKRTKLSKKDENRAREEAREFFERYLEVEDILEMNSPPFPRVDLCAYAHTDIGRQAAAAARNLRKCWKLGLNAIPNVHELLEDRGIKVKEISAPDCLDGFSGWADHLPVIVLAEWLNKDLPRKRLTATHELGHLYLKLPASMNHKQVETVCYQFGTAFLIPDEEFVVAFGGERSRVSLGELIAIKEEWGLSLGAIMRRARDLGLISDRHYVNFVIQSKKRGWGPKTPEPGDWIGCETASRFKQLVLQAASKELITRSKAAGLLGVELRQLDKDLTWV